MKKWYLSLANRERYLVNIAAIVMIIFSWLDFIYLPIFELKNNQEKQLLQTRDLYQWINNKIAQIDLGRFFEPQILHPGNDNLLPYIESSIKKSELASYLTDLSEIKSNTFKLNLNDVNYTLFMSWLWQLIKSANLEIVQISISKSKFEGQVNISMILAKK